MIKFDFRLGNFLYVACILFLFFAPAKKMIAQEYQLWLDGYLYKSFGEGWQYEGNIGYNKLLEPDSWASYYFNNTLTWDIKKWYTLEGSLEINYTDDPQGPEILEFRPWIGMDFYFAQYIKQLRLYKPYFYWRFEERILRYSDEDTVDYKSRIRPRIGGKILLNNTTLTDKTLYVPFYFEGFINLNGVAYERFASRLRLALGIGYRLNPMWRFELYTYLQDSKNTVDDSFEKTDAMLQLRIKYYLE